MKALLIIDMQKLSFTPETPRYDTEGIVDRINKLAEQFRKKGDKVIFIQHDGTKDGYCFPGTEGWEMLDSLKIEPSDLIVPKTVNDAFYKSSLRTILNDSKINELVITGCATDFCVDSTVKSALVNDFNITVISDGHTTADRPGLTAKQLIDHYNWVWNDMNPTEGKIIVENSANFLEKMGNQILTKY